MDARPRLGLVGTLRNAYRGARAGVRAAWDGFTLGDGGTASSSPYEGATTGRRLGAWGLGTWGPNAAVHFSARTLRSRQRELTRNNPWMRNAENAYVANLIGTGIVPRWASAPDPVKAEIHALLAQSIDQIDADGRHDMYGQQALVARTWFRSGEVLARFRPRRRSDGLAVPLQVQILEPDHLDESQDGQRPGGRFVRMGIEFDGLGRRVGYWLRRNHPGDMLPMSGAGMYDMQPVFVPASEVLHVFHAERPGQIRGLPRAAPVILRFFDFDLYEDAELVRKKGAAAIGGWIEQAEELDAQDEVVPFGRHDGLDEEGQLQIAYDPGMWGVLEPGQKPHFVQHADVGSSYSAWVKQQLRSIAAGLDVTYEQLTGDLTDVNYSSIRAGLVEIRRRLEQQIWQVMIHQFCQPVMERWLEVAVASGAIDIPDFAAHRAMYTDIGWRPQRWPWVDPLKDVQAERMAVRSGFKSRTSVVGELGDDIEAVDRELAEDNARADELGLVLDSDPRRVNTSGAAQSLPEDGADRRDAEG